MNTLEQSRIEKINREGYPFLPGAYLMTGSQVFGKYVGGFAGFTALYFVIILTGNVIPFIGSLTSILLGPPLIAGFFLMAHHLDGEQPGDFSLFFRGFDFFGQLVLQALIQAGVLVGIIIVLVVITARIWSNLFDAYETGFFLEKIGGVMALFGLFGIPILILSVLWRWGPLFVLFYQMGPWQALEGSRKIIARNFWPQLGFSLLLALIVVAGFIALGFGALFALPLVYCAEYIAFSEVTQLGKTTTPPDEEIIDHLID